MKAKNNFSGFTLIELLVVISIIGILAGFLFVNFASVRERGRDARRKSDLQSIKTALRLYYNDYQAYPDNSASGQIAGCGAAGDAACAWGAAFGSASTTYMTLPVDPINSGSYVYTFQNISDDDFRLTAVLETSSDQQAAASQRACGIAEAQIVANVYMVCNQ